LPPNWAEPPGEQRAGITLARGDITDQQIDAIHRRGGPQILAECRALRAASLPSGLPTGHAVATTGGQLPAAHVIHVVGPVYSRREDRSALLVSCYREALRVADQLGALTVAMPAVSAGIYGWPMRDAARIAVQTVRETATSVQEVRFVLFSEDAYDAFAEALAG
jgi:O-acetyl-ADP-ribose deacetylase (regulator of RNase III)